MLSQMTINDFDDARKDLAGEISYVATLISDPDWSENAVEIGAELRSLCARFENLTVAVIMAKAEEEENRSVSTH